jgi:hypothetical protein
MVAGQDDRPPPGLHHFDAVPRLPTNPPSVLPKEPDRHALVEQRPHAPKVGSGLRSGKGRSVDWNRPVSARS